MCFDQMFRCSNSFQPAKQFHLLLFLILLLAGASRTVAQPANNNFANSQALTGNSGNLSGSSVGATAETGQPPHAGVAAQHSGWYRGRGPLRGRATFVVNSTAFRSGAAIYTGNSVGGLTP